MGGSKEGSGPPSSRSDRRKYRRIRAPLHYRSVDSSPPLHHGEALDISLGGVRIYSHKALPIGAVIELEIFRPDGPPAAYKAQVMWVSPLGDDAPARFDLGLRFVEIEPNALTFLMRVIDPL
jgi:c-di-GMP-binding flagellar brake protein YcgR